MLHHIIVNLIAAFPDRRADCRQYILRPASVYPCHCTNHRTGNFRNRPFPARMGQTRSLLHRIIEIQRHAIRVKGSEQHTRHVGHQPVCRLESRNSIPAAAAALRRCNNSNMFAVSLLPAGPVIQAKAQTVREQPPVKKHILRIITDMKSAIEAVIRRFAGSPVPARKAGSQFCVHMPRLQLKQHRHIIILNKRFHSLTSA
ncbi:hypothetical protein D3C73_975890 [compost metagenome]